MAPDRSVADIYLPGTRFSAIFGGRICVSSIKQLVFQAMYHYWSYTLSFLFCFFVSGDLSTWKGGLTFPTMGRLLCFNDWPLWWTYLHCWKSRRTCCILGSPMQRCTQVDMNLIEGPFLHHLGRDLCSTISEGFLYINHGQVLCVCVFLRFFPVVLLLYWLVFSDDQRQEGSVFVWNPILCHKFNFASWPPQSIGGTVNSTRFLWKLREPPNRTAAVYSFSTTKIKAPFTNAPPLSLFCGSSNFTQMSNTNPPFDLLASAHSGLLRAN